LQIPADSDELNFNCDQKLGMAKALTPSTTGSDLVQSRCPRKRFVSRCARDRTPASRRSTSPCGDEVKDVDLGVKRVLQGIGKGNIAPVEGEKVASIRQNYRETIEVQEMVQRIEALEKHMREQESRRRDEKLTKIKIY
jgi:hypothetical protein